MQKWHKALGTVAVGLLAALPLSGCVARPAPRPAPRVVPEGVAGISPGATSANVNGAINPSLSAAVTSTAAGVGGAGTTEALVIGNGALVALQLNHPHPGGAAGQPLTGKADYAGSSPSGGPVHVQGPGSSVGASPARPGGQISPGAPPGGSPNYTSAVANSSGDLAGTGGTNTSPAPVPGATGSSPMAVMTRVADMIRAKHPAIVEVRFANTPEDAVRLAELARTVRSGAANVSDGEVRTIWHRSIPAGTSRFPIQYPPQGTYPMTR